MSKTRRKSTGSRPPFYKRFQINKLLTPQERQALGLVFGLFLLGLFVRWYRLAHLH